jgi:hypothetical protein
MFYGVGCGNYQNKGLHKVKLRSVQFPQCPQLRALYDIKIDVSSLIFFLKTMIPGGYQLGTPPCNM